MSEDLQFDRAEYADAAASRQCVQCNGALTDAYFAVGDHVLCRGCAEKLRAQLDDHGSPGGRVVRAVGAGFGAALLGSLLYYGVLALTGYEFGLIAIVVGYAVGAAVRWGSYGRGGWAYQTLAITLTYLSIVSAYVPDIVSAIRQSERPAVAAGATGSNATHANVQPASGNDAPAAADPEPTLGGALFAIAVLLLFAAAALFLAGVQNILGLVIIGIGLYQAWKLNRRVVLEVTGPHPVNAPV